ncbi:hypothetical protein HNW77_11280 [Komagataeibacter sp. AV436]|uniref:Uncharacterized protein n=1 Tax=Komagataeibacter melomenusus TaxID=2766578 RepID=A0ABX2AF79_9PROT|nr:hypothetical protein [Komagataeibacter melomenusus]MBV1831524.1 hypothetical protein [Komagataeibacter melomenusus]NPC66964.1 hypothetical protein [Komagataeibacter melomenusus]
MSYYDRFDDVRTIMRTVANNRWLECSPANPKDRTTFILLDICNIIRLKLEYDGTTLYQNIGDAERYPLHNFDDPIHELAGTLGVKAITHIMQPDYLVLHDLEDYEVLGAGAPSCAPPDRAYDVCSIIHCATYDLYTRPPTPVCIVYDYASITLHYNPTYARGRQAGRRRRGFLGLVKWFFT